MKECPVCHGSGKGQPTSTGMESSWRINQYLMKQDCGYCKGKGEVPNKRKPTEAEKEIYRI